ncbi:uncharacterized protein LOC114915094 [Cajanus cajan]|uniref:uncharacterized protein LOC114915094 n=1 Tax=Cajanus cajan TaxID=3821 RepID=UPI0010FB4B5C|nr:uncharacterized protein LOC114915094 [Cajanus cajan]
MVLCIVLCVGIMGKSKWRELKEKYGDKDVEIAKVGEEKLEAKKKKQRVGDKDVDSSRPGPLQAEIKEEKGADTNRPAGDAIHQTASSSHPIVVADVNIPCVSTSGVGREEGSKLVVVILDEETISMFYYFLGTKLL